MKERKLLNLGYERYGRIVCYFNGRVMIIRFIFWALLYFYNKLRCPGSVNFTLKGYWVYAKRERATPIVLDAPDFITLWKIKEPNEANS